MGTTCATLCSRSSAAVRGGCVLRSCAIRDRCVLAADRKSYPAAPSGRPPF
jgi:hypothetical protein